ncbi:head-tail adaptor [Rhodovulum imhoffii]|uniref:Head-tail adaptor n=1 Tax=Rhodovulum imhoffii TaxID=365340 RepID=A0A2T5BVB0_9RHOB|nr:head-tail adaptor protein [Rhodovulum imhoffii]MBK5934231.1 phage tail protein [Rhodovulum imhoffii]PTN03522.1 head-tail adaptor [Rhodovulum imhoffii]
MTPPVLSRRFSLERLRQVPDGAGGYAVVWEILGNLWAELIPQAGGSRMAGELTISRVSCRIIVRAAPVGAPSRPEPGQRLREGVRVFRILAVAETDAKGRYLTCHAEEEGAA